MYMNRVVVWSKVDDSPHLRASQCWCLCHWVSEMPEIDQEMSWFPVRCCEFGQYYVPYIQSHV